MNKPSTRKSGFLFLAAALLFSATGCLPGFSGDHLADSPEHFSKEPVIPRQADTISLSIVENRTKNSHIPEILHFRVNESLRKEGRLIPVSPEDNPDLSAYIRVLGYSIHNIDFNSHGEPVKKRMRISVTITLAETHPEKIIIRSSPVETFREYSEIQFPAETEKSALNNLLIHLADRITARITTGWYTEYMTPVEKGQR